MDDLEACSAGREELLDELFDVFVEELREERDPDLARHVERHPELREELEELLALAHRVAVRRPAAMPSLPGYEVVSEIGRGAMGVVYLARQERLGGRLVALKVLPEAVALSARSRRRFLSEARALGTLRHPSIVAVHDVIDAGPALAYAMEWIDGPSLDEVVRRLRASRSRSAAPDPTRALGEDDVPAAKRDPVRFACEVAVSVAQALAAVHSAGLLHRDVKPSNVLLRRDGHALLSDFGLVHDESHAHLSQAGTFVGTVAFASPEQLRGERERMDARSDVYSLGATLYQTLALRTPYLARTVVGLLEEMRGASAPPVRNFAPWVPRDVETVCAKAMALDPDERYGTAAELAGDLRRFLDDRPVLARRPGVMSRAARAIRRHRGSVVAAVVGGILAAATVAGLLLDRFWVEQHVERLVVEARTRLLHPGHMELSVVQARGRGSAEQSETYVRKHLLAGEFDPALRLPLAIDAYDRALFWRSAREDLRSERAVAAAALRLLLGEPMRVGSTLDLSPRVESYARTWPGLAGQMTAPAEDVLQGATQRELRDLGLLAFLLMDAATCNAAWARLERTAGEDPLVDAAEGMLLCGERDYGPASNRLLAATRYFRGVGFLQVAAALAALRLEDVEQARRLADRAKSMELQDPYETLLLVRADLRAVQGDFDGAAEAYEELASRHISSESRRHWMLLEVLRGRPRRALSLWVPSDAELREEPLFAWVAERWWSTCSEEEKLAAVARDLDLPADLFHGRPSLVRLVPAAREHRFSGGGRIPEALTRSSSFARLLAKNMDSRNLGPPGASSSPEGPPLHGLVQVPGLLSTDLETRMKISVRYKTALARLAWRADDIAWKQGEDGLPGASDRRAGAPWGAFTSGALLAGALAPGAGAQALVDSICGAAANDRLGVSVEILGDVNGDGVADYAVGSPVLTLTTVPGSVSAYSGTAPPVHLWTTTGSVSGDHFGSYMVRIDDRDGDGVADLAVGALQTGTGTGYVQVLSAATGALIGAPIHGTSTGDMFGRSLAPIEDLNGDGLGELIVGAIQRQVGNGYVVVVDLTSGAQVGPAIVGPSFDSRCGNSVDSIDDLDGDGVQDLLVGAYNHHAPVGSAGFAAAYSSASMTEIGSAFVAPPGSRNFGISVMSLGDVDGDGIPDCAIGTRGYGTALRGYVQVFSGAGPSHTEIWSAMSANGDQLGTHLARVADLDGDGVDDIAAGAPQPPLDSATGYVRIYSGVSGTVLGQLQQGAADDDFGRVVAAGDVDGDGADELLVGAPNNACGGALSGRLWIFDTTCDPPSSYCTAAPNSVGDGAQIGWAGHCSHSTNDLRLKVSGAPPGQPGLFYYGDQQVSMPFGDGVRCVAGTLYRLSVVQVDGAGEVDQLLDLQAPPTPAAAIYPGDVVNFQFWYRDPLGGPAAFNLSDGLEVAFGF